MLDYNRVMPNDYTQTLLEDMNSKFDAVIDMVFGMRQEMARQTDLDIVKADVKLLKTAVTKTNLELKTYRTRLSRQTL